MATSVLTSIGRCSGLESPLSVRDFLFGDSHTPELSLRDRLDTPLQRGETVADWLQFRPRIRDQIYFQDVLGPWVSWPLNRKQKLQGLVDDFAACGMSNLTDPPANEIPQFTFWVASQAISRNAAEDLFLAYLAQTLVIEMGHWLPWSILEYDDACLFGLLNSLSMFHWNPSENHYEIERNPHGRAVPADPRVTFEFLNQTNIIGTSRMDTIVRAVNWCRWNLAHHASHPLRDSSGNLVRDWFGEVVWAGGKNDTYSMDIHWDYEGFPPVRRVMEGTTNKVTGEFGHFTAGCHGTVGFLRAILRAANIPVRYVERCGHALAHFMHVNRYLSHGDDPYNQKARRDDLDPADLLIDMATFILWFGFDDQACDAQIEGNIGRGVREAAAGLPDLE